MSEPCASLAVVLFGVTLLADETAFVVELKRVDKGFLIEAVNTTAWTACRFGAHPSEGASAVISRPR